MLLNYDYKKMIKDLRQARDITNEEYEFLLVEHQLAQIAETKKTDDLRLYGDFSESKTINTTQQNKLKK